MAAKKFDYLKKAQNRINKDADYRKLGNTDVRLALAVGNDARLITFEAFQVAAIEELAMENLRDAEVVLKMGTREWNAYLKKRKAGRGPTLLSLDLDRDVVSASTPLAKIKFERYNRSLQAFVDACARYAA